MLKYKVTNVVLSAVGILIQSMFVVLKELILEFEILYQLSFFCESIQVQAS